MEAIVKVTNGRKITIPKKIGDELDIKAGDYLAYIPDKSGHRFLPLYRDTLGKLAEKSRELHRT